MMKRKKIILGSVCALLLPGAIVFARFTHIPEPVFQGVRLGSYLDDPAKCDHAAQQKFKAMGREAVPYLIDQMKPDLLHEIFAKVHPKLPMRVQKAVPDPLIYQNRRITAAMLLSILHTNAADCLPVAMELLEKNDPAVKAYCIGLAGLHAPGTVYEERALRLLLAACTYTAPMDRDRTRAAIYWLGRNFRRHKEEIIPVLLLGLSDPNTARSSTSALVRFGTNAIPSLESIVARENGTHGPATKALAIVQSRIGMETL